MERSKRAFQQERIIEVGALLYHVLTDSALNDNERREVLLLSLGHLEAWKAMVERKLEGRDL